MADEVLVARQRGKLLGHIERFETMLSKAFARGYERFLLNPWLAEFTLPEIKNAFLSLNMHGILMVSSYVDPETTTSFIQSRLELI